ncbi:MAG: hypothetical protein V4736_08955, partial [Bdellovibrionota bacterium]
MTYFILSLMFLLGTSQAYGQAACNVVLVKKVAEKPPRNIDQVLDLLFYSERSVRDDRGTFEDGTNVFYKEVLKSKQLGEYLQNSGLSLTDFPTPEGKRYLLAKYVDWFFRRYEGPQLTPVQNKILQDALKFRNHTIDPSKSAMGNLKEISKTNLNNILAKLPKIKSPNKVDLAIIDKLESIYVHNSVSLFEAPDYSILSAGA